MIGAPGLSGMPPAEALSSCRLLTQLVICNDFLLRLSGASGPPEVT